DPCCLCISATSKLLSAVLAAFVFFCGSGPHRDLHSFPTRRSSDLQRRAGESGNPQWPADGRGVRGWHREAGSGNRELGRLDHPRSEEHTSELQSRENLVCRLLLEKKKSILEDGTQHDQDTKTTNVR